MSAAADAERIARERYGIEARATALPGEIDLNFALDGAAGRHVLKLYAPATDPELLDLQDAALEHLAGVGAVPRLVRTRDGGARTQQGERLVRVLTWVAGAPWAASDAHTPAMLASLGRTVAGVDRALASFDHPALPGRLRWNMLAAGDLAGDATGDAAAVLERFGAEILPRLRALPAQAIHNDANEHNVLVGDDGAVCGLIDFGDLCRAPRVCGLAVACAYAMAMLPVPERELLPLVAGYHEVAPLGPEELALLPDLIRARLAMSIAMAVRQRRDQPDNEYLLISQEAVPALLSRLGPVPHELEHLRLRSACGYEAVPHARAVRGFLQTAEAGPVCGPPLETAPVLDWSAGTAGAGAPPATVPALGRYLEDRDIYDSAAFATELPGERRTLHLGVDVFLDAGEPILAPLDGVVRDSAHRPAARDFGGVVLVDHATPDGVTFHTLYGHLSARAAGAGRAARARRRDRGHRHGGRERRLGAAPAPAAAQHRPRRRLRRPRGRHASPSATSGSPSARTPTSCSGCAAASAPSRRD